MAIIYADDTVPFNSSAPDTTLVKNVIMTRKYQPLAIRERDTRQTDTVMNIKREIYSHPDKSAHLKIIFLTSQPNDIM